MISPPGSSERGFQPFRVILADPPWRWRAWGRQTTRKVPYQVMRTADIAALPVGQIVDRDSVLFLWANWPIMPECFEVMKAWGFQYRALGFDWIKLNKNGMGVFQGMGYYTRSNPEPCLIGVRGHPKRVADKSIPATLLSPWRGHSRKPVEVYDRINRLYPYGPKLELFATKESSTEAMQHGWDRCMGYDVDGRDIREVLEDLIEKPRAG